MAEIAVDGYRYRLPSRGMAAGKAILAVRPSRLIIGAEDGFEATVLKTTYVGIRMEYTLKTSFGEIFAVDDNVGDPLSAGQELRDG